MLKKRKHAKKEMKRKGLRKRKKKRKGIRKRKKRRRRQQPHPHQREIQMTKLRVGEHLYLNTLDKFMISISS